MEQLHSHEQVKAHLKQTSDDISASLISDEDATSLHDLLVLSYPHVCKPSAKHSKDTKARAKKEEEKDITDRAVEAIKINHPIWWSWVEKMSPVLAPLSHSDDEGWSQFHLDNMESVRKRARGLLRSCGGDLYTLPPKEYVSSMQASMCLCIARTCSGRCSSSVPRRPRNLKAMTLVRLSN